MIYETNCGGGIAIWGDRPRKKVIENTKGHTLFLESVRRKRELKVKVDAGTYRHEETAVQGDEVSVRRLVLLAARIITGGTFILASLDKIAHPGLFAEIVRDYRILPHIVVLPFSYALPWFELILGIFLIVGFFPNRSAFVAAILVFVFIVAIIIRAMQGPISDCGCFSVSPEIGNQGVLMLLFRDLILLALCVLNVFPNILMPNRAGRAS